MFFCDFRCSNRAFSTSPALKNGECESRVAAGLSGRKSGSGQVGFTETSGRDNLEQRCFGSNQNVAVLPHRRQLSTMQEKTAPFRALMKRCVLFLDKGLTRTGLSIWAYVNFFFELIKVLKNVQLYIYIRGKKQG